jgi:hypothetical protein
MWSLLGPNQTDNINRMITIRKLQLLLVNVITLSPNQTDNINRMMTIRKLQLTLVNVITLGNAERQRDRMQEQKKER